MFTKFNTAQSGREFPLVIKHLGCMLRRNISNFYAVLFLQSVFAFVMDIFLNSRRWSSILNVGGSQFVAVFYQNTHQSMLTYSLLMIFITAITMFNREERSACYAMPCTPQVETWAKEICLNMKISIFYHIFCSAAFSGPAAHSLYGIWAGKYTERQFLLYPRPAVGVGSGPLFLWPYGCRGGPSPWRTVLLKSRVGFILCRGNGSSGCRDDFIQNHSPGCGCCCGSHGNVLF